MKEAVALVHAYVPPDPARIQQCVNAGKLSVNPVEPGLQRNDTILRTDRAVSFSV